MHPFDFHCPTRIVFGPGRFDDLGTLAAEVTGPGRVLVVTDPGIVAAGHAARAVERLRAAGFTTLLFDGTRENPTTQHVDAGLAVARDFRPNCLVAVGGGSSMDCAKGINFVYSCGGNMRDYWGVGKAKGPLLPMIAVPTTAGTGSEAQSFALISDADSHAKMACGDKRAAFRLAVLDPELTLTQPQRVTALTAIDALSHTLETLVTTRRNQLSLAFTREAWRLLAGGLERVLADPRDLAGRGWVQQGACLAGLAIENSMLGAAHALANPLTAEFGVAHGEAVGLVLPHVIRHNAGDAGCQLAYDELLVAIGRPGSRSETAGIQLAEQVGDWRDRFGLASRLMQLGVESPDLPRLAIAASKQWTGTFNPRSMSVDDYQAIYDAAL